MELLKMITKMVAKHSSHKQSTLARTPIVQMTKRGSGIGLLNFILGIFKTDIESRGEAELERKRALSTIS